MRVQLSLLLLAIVGGTLAAINPQTLGLQDLGSRQQIHYWLYALKSFAVPLCLMLVSWKLRRFGRWLTLLWSAWILLLSAAVILSLNESVPSINLYGIITLACVSIVVLALIVFVSIELSRQVQKITAEEAKARQATH